MAAGRGAIEKLILLGDKGNSSRHVPEARHKAVEFAKQLLPGAYLSKKLLFRDGWAAIQVTEGRRRIIIYTDPGGPEYEFFTSEGIYSDFLGSPPFDGSGDVYVCGRGSNHKFTKMGASRSNQALVELCGTCSTPSGAPWPVYACDDIDGEDLMRTPYAWQNQRAWEHVWWQNNNGARFVTSAAGAVPGYSSVGKLSRMNYAAGFVSKNLVEDAGWDLRPSLYSVRGSDAIAHGAPLLSSPDWWRRACMQTVNGVDYFIMTDAAGNFHFWPAGNYGGIYVPSGLVKTVTPIYPAWVSPGNGLALWNFNSKGTRAACCPYEHFEPALTRGGDTVYKDTAFGFWRVTPVSAPGWYGPCYEDSPGLIEVDISVIWDESAGDWFPSVTVVRDEKFSDTGRYFVDADYLFKDARLPYEEDTLVALSMDMWIEGGDYFRYTAGSHWPDDFNGVVKAALAIEAWYDDPDPEIPPVWVEMNRIITHSPAEMEFSSTALQGVDVTGDAVADFYGYPDTFRTYAGNQKYYVASVGAINLRSLSWLQTHQGSNDLLTESYFGHSLYAYGELVDQNLEAGLDIPLWDTTGFVVADRDKRELWSNGYHEIFDTAPTLSISPHPKGHWAVATNVFNGYMVDIVNVRSKGGDVRTTHQALYNDAYNDNRDVQYYIDLGNPAGADAPLGTFKTFGIWRDR